MRPLLGAVFLMAAGAATADPVRVATFNASLSRDAPGILIKDLLDADDQVFQALDIVGRVAPDIILLNEVDYDAGGEALRLIRAALKERGLDYPHAFLEPVNTGIPSGLDLNGDGDTTDPQDAWGFGYFPGQYGMLVLSRFPIDRTASATFQTLRWRDLPGAKLPVDAAGAPFPSETAQTAMRLSSKSHWDVAIDTPDGRLHLLASHPTPPVFDGPEDMNGLRNRDEIRLWSLYLDGEVLPSDTGPRTRAQAPFVILGDLNADPVDGERVADGIGGLLSHPLVQDPGPASAGGVAAAASQGGANASHAGDPALDTSDWNDTRGPGNLRVDYVLPSADLTVAGSGVFWPAPGDPDHALVAASDHRLVWVDIMLPSP